MVHAAAVLGLAIDGVQVPGPDAVAKTLPDFVERWAGCWGSPPGSSPERPLRPRQPLGRGRRPGPAEPPWVPAAHPHPAGARRRRPRPGGRRRPRPDDRAASRARRRPRRRHRDAGPRAGQARRRRRRPGAAGRRHQRPHRLPRPDRRHRGADDVAAAHRRRHRPHRADRRRQRRPAGDRHLGHRPGARAGLPRPLPGGRLRRRARAAALPDQDRPGQPAAAAGPVRRPRHGRGARCRARRRWTRCSTGSPGG